MLRCLKLPLDPNSNGVFIWNFLQCIAIHVSYVFVWFQAAINADISWHLAMIYLMDFMYLLYVLSQFVTSYKHKGRVIKEYRKIGREVAKTIVIDVFSLLPLEIFSFASDDQVLIAAYLRLNRCVRFFRVFKFFSNMESNIMTSSFFWVSLKAISASLLSMHFWSCIWYMIACDNISDGGRCKNGSWANTTELDYGINMNEAGSYQRYLASYYWSITTITTVGYGEIRPQNWKEKLTALICMIVECTKLSIILGILAALLTNRETKVSTFKYHLKIVREHMLKMTLPETLRKRVVDRYEYMWKENKGEEIENVLNVLPQNLRTALFTETHQTMLDAIALQFMQRNSPHYLRQLSQMIKPALYLPGEVIIRKGEIGDGLYFLQRGNIEVIDGSGQVKYTLNVGDSFGKINLMCKMMSTVTIRAGTLCELAILSASDFHILEKHYPIIGLQLRTNLRTQFAESCANAQEEPNSIILIDDGAVIEGILSEGEAERFGSIRQSKQRQIKDLPQKVGTIQRTYRKFIDYIVVPGSKFYIIWNALMFITILFTVWIYCYMAAFTRFKPNTGYNSGSSGRVVFAFTYVIDVLFIADMIVSMKIAYEGANAIVVDQPWAVLVHYVKSWKFLLDFIAILPIEIFSVVWNDPWNYVALYKLNRVFKWWRLWVILEDDLSHSVRVSSSKVHFLRMFVYIPTITHIGACIWFMIACFHDGKCLKDSWAHQQRLSLNTTALHDYVTSLYWATTTMTTVGYGDITPYNDRDKILAISAMITGIILYGYILGAVAATLTSALASKVAFRGRLHVVKEFVRQHTTDRQLPGRIHHHYNLLWKQSRGEANCVSNLLSDLPESLREEVLFTDLRGTIENIPWFANTDLSFMKKLASSMTVYLYSPGDFIMYHGDIYHEMFCVRKGIVEVLAENLSHVIAKIGPGGYFGELCLLCKSRSIITARAATHCELLGIDRLELESILKEFPAIKSQLQKISRAFRKTHIIDKLANITSRKRTIPPRSFIKHDTFSALAVSMTVPINIVTRQSVLTKIVANLTDNIDRIKLACPLSVSTYPNVTFLKYNPDDDKVLTLDEMGIALSRGEQVKLMRIMSNRLSESQLESLAERHQRSTTSTNSSQSGEIGLHHFSTKEKIQENLKKIFACILLPYVFMPKSKASVVWEILICVLSFTSCITISLQASYYIKSPPLWTINYFIDAFFYIDIVLKVHTAYFNAEGILVTAPVMCAIHYLKTNLLLDFLGNCPTELLSLAIWNGDELLTMLSLVRLNRLIRAYKLILIFDYVEESMYMPANLLKSIKFFIFLGLGTHWISCCWYTVACSVWADTLLQVTGDSTCTTSGWVFQETALTPFATNDSRFRRYVTTFYWASASSTSVGYGDIVAYTDFERTYALTIMIISVIAYGYMLGSIAAGLTNTASLYSAFKEKISAIKVFLKDNKVDSSITQRVVCHYAHLWQKERGIDLQNIFEGLPVSLKADIALNLHKKLIEQVPIFQNADTSFLKLLALSCKPVFFLSGELILKKGDLGNAIYFISTGIVEIFAGKDESIRITQICAGNFFGEISCLLGCRITATVKAKTNCDLFILSKADLKYCLRHYPDIAEHIKTVAKKRYHSLKLQEQSVALPDVTVGDFSQPDELFDQDAQNLKQFCPSRWLMIDSESYTGQIVSAIGHFLALFTSLVLPYQASFVDTSVGWYVVSYLAELYFVIELILKFFTIYQDKDGNRITSNKAIAFHYLRSPTGLIFDLVLLLPIEIFAIPISDDDARTVTFLCLRLHRVLRIVRLLPFMRGESQQFRALMSLHMVAIGLQCVLLLTLSTHWSACLWYAIGCPATNCRTESWARLAGLVDTDQYHYLVSLYWSVTTLTTTGYGEISATNVLEMIISSCVMIIGKLMFGFILGNVASEIFNWNKNLVEFKGKIIAIKGLINAYSAE
ncbi:uncharacterized protein [Dysidea avara]|uniref:uncharacterized protein isoform X2 n=1 Tax=Dysidea avara TaxID=196820 RepID=UPI00332AEA57